MPVAKNQRWSLYLIRCKNGELYTGITLNVRKRFKEHQAQSNKTAKYLRGKGPLTLVFKQEIGSKSEALKVEGKIKKMPKHQKEKVIKENKFYK